MAAKSAEGQYRQDAELYFIIRGIIVLCKIIF